MRLTLEHGFENIFGNWTQDQGEGCHICEACDECHCVAMTYAFQHSDLLLKLDELVSLRFHYSIMKLVEVDELGS